MLSRKAPAMPGQLENCDICEKRFTVTAYSKTGLQGGLLCTKCSKELKQDDKKKQEPKKRGAQKARRRQTESDRMMGDVHPGARSLLETCVRIVAANIVDIEEFGDLPQHLLDRLSQILSQKRALDPRTLELFLRSESTSIAIYDAAKLDTEDFEKIFSFMPELEDVNLRHAGQVKDEVLLYMLEHNTKVRHLQLGAANLVTNDAWIRLFKQQGPLLESFKTSDLDAAMDDDAIDALVKYCGSNLRRLKLKKCWQTTERSILALCGLTELRHLTLSISPDASCASLVRLITSLGPKLQTLSLENFRNADDSVLAAIHTSCSQLTKLRFTNNSNCTDAGFTSLFTDWSNPPLSHIDLSDNRSIDNQNPDGDGNSDAADAGAATANNNNNNNNNNNKINGLSSNGFHALVTHSHSTLQTLNIKACRHISLETLLDLFFIDPVPAQDPAESQGRRSHGRRKFPHLRVVDMSFVAQLDDTVVAAMFRACPHLHKLTIFGCHRVNDVRVPPGVAVIGLMRAMENVVLEGE